MDKKIKKKKWTIGKISSISFGVLFVSFILYNFIFADKGSKLNVSSDKINVSEVVKGQFREFIPVDGNVMPIKTIRLDAIEGGNVERKYLEGGEMVSKGDTILKLANNNLVQNFVREETQTFRLVNELANTKLALQRNKFELKRRLTTLNYDIDAAKDAYERGAKLRDDKVISEQEYLNLKRAYDRLVSTKEIEIESQIFDTKSTEAQIRQTTETLERTRKNLKMIKGNLDNLYIKAPISGSLSSVNVEIGESIMAGQNIGQIDDLDAFKVRATIDEHYIARIYEGLEGTFDFAGETHKLKIYKIYPEVINGLFSVDLKFENELPTDIRRGQTLQIKLQLSENIEAVQIPRGSFYQTTGGNWVFVVDESGDFAMRRNIRLGRQNPRFYEVIEGLQPGEKVVVSSYDGYEDKDRLVFK
ncbi:efflux RND transporter periplasmic adaptor subunit [Reichenbachiella carrageenanivorans]|uniref:Efflux RND transporter periplasmic adaptor subunit n=1 Tax=Reichenbachiella carrageenanivorans TaxID=2979869 RepID=A0ABY6D0H3_9BACT|nr:efflux RND transporter periplasmic adaptor subunit [Reichenbachiella carrageenanivorans]UXX79647.1 efflux RND transporter periplasmic adaptor subunit [Reichenbachiella carrageenanivorans]